MINGKKALLILGAIAAMNEIVIDAKKDGLLCNSYRLFGKLSCKKIR